MTQKWYDKLEKNHDVVLSCRIRLARNFNDMMFAKQMKPDDTELLLKRARDIVPGLCQLDQEPYDFYEVSHLRDIDKASMVEWHIISDKLAGKTAATGLILSKDEEIGIMINEEDHTKIQITQEGMNLSRALDKANEIDDYISEHCEYAFDPRYGYLTGSPTDVGTGLRASYFLFLPALGLTGKIDQLTEEVNKYGIQIRSVYSDTNKNFPHIYQMFNKTTLGRSEGEIIDHLNQITVQTVEQERKRREYILSVNSDEIEDKVYRSYGVLKYARKITTVDSLLMLSQLKFGIDVNLLEFASDLNIIKTMMEITPANIQKICGKQMSRNERDRYRALYLNRVLPAVVSR